MSIVSDRVTSRADTGSTRGDELLRRRRWGDNGHCEMHDDADDADDSDGDDDHNECGDDDDEVRFGKD